MSRSSSAEGSPSRRKGPSLPPLHPRPAVHTPPPAPIDLPETITIQENGTKIEIDCRKLEVECELGRGAYGVVEVMRHPESDFLLAVKRIRATDVEEEKKRLCIEVETMKTANCPFMVFCYGAMFREGDVWIGMEIMDLSLDQFYTQCLDLKLKMPENVLSKIAYSVIVGLDYMKNKLNMMHRDVKPSNILVNRTGEVKLCDFGISSTLRDSVEKTAQAGCKPYMAPERIAGNKQHKYDWKTDVWSLGITMIEAATGTHPYDRWKSIWEQLNQVVHQPSPSLPQNGGFSTHFHDFISHCLLKDYNFRSSYEELLTHEWISCQDDTKVDGFIRDIIDARKKAKNELPDYEDFELLTLTDFTE